MVLGLLLEHFTPLRCSHNPSISCGCMGTSRRWNAAVGPCSAIAALAKLGTFSHTSVNDFGTNIIAFHPLEVLQQPLSSEGVYGHTQEMKYYSSTLFRHCRTSQTNRFFSYKRQWFWNLYWSISPLGGASIVSQYRGCVWALPRDEMLQLDPIMPLPHLPNYALFLI